MSNAILYRIPAGIPGALSKGAGQATIETGIFAAANYPEAFGVFVKYSSGKVAKLVGAESTTDVVGVLVRPYPTQYTSSEALGAATPDITKLANIMKRGYIMVKLAFGTASKGAQVYACVSADGGNAIGDIGDSSDSGHCIAVPGAYFTGGADDNGNVEIAYNI